MSDDLGDRMKRYEQEETHARFLGALVAYDRMTKRNQLDVMIENSKFPSHETDLVV